MARLQWINIVKVSHNFSGIASIRGGQNESCFILIFSRCALRCSYALVYCFHGGFDASFKIMYLIEKIGRSAKMLVRPLKIY